MVEETSAGGFVLAADGADKVALIGRETRSGRLEWCVPKGHPEGDESIEVAAVREVAEETGLICEIISPLGVIDYKFQAGGKLIHKTVHHFLMRQIGGELTIENDPDQEAVDVKWVSLEELSGILAHENERRMARGVIEWVERNR
jgi:ADP-ribose pyrophosphatase YjhB (NUDIX family)